MGGVRWLGAQPLRGQRPRQGETRRSAGEGVGAAPRRAVTSAQVGGARSFAVGRQQSASGPSGSAPIALRPGSPAGSLGPADPARAAGPAPSSEGPEAGRGGCAAPLAMSSRRQVPRPLPAAAAPFIFKAPQPRAPVPRALTGEARAERGRS